MEKLSLPATAIAGVVACLLQVPTAYSCVTPGSQCDQQNPLGEKQAGQNRRQRPQVSELDKTYQLVLKAFEEAYAAWRQRPDDPAALDTRLAGVRNQVAALREESAEEARASRPATAPESANQAAVKAPAGPVQPSQQPSPEEEVRKRTEATLGRFLSGPIEEAPESERLEGVPHFWIIRSCNLAEEELDKIGILLKSDVINPDAVESSLKQLRAILLGTSSPPPSTPPVTPKGPKEAR